MKTIREKTLDAALHACQTARPASYAPPSENFPRVTNLIRAWFEVRGIEDGDVGFSEFDYVVTMIMVKLARLAYNPRHFDSWVDIAGWGACGAEVCHAVPPADVDTGLPLRVAKLTIQELQERLMEDRNVTRIAELEGLNDGLRSHIVDLEAQLDKITTRLTEVALALTRAGLEVRDGWMVATQETELPLGDDATQ